MSLAGYMCGRAPGGHTYAPSMHLSPPEVAAETARRIRENPHTYMQHVWLERADGGAGPLDSVAEWCDTFACVAGHAAHVAHPELEMVPSDNPDEQGWVLIKGEVAHVFDVAAEALGLNKVADMDPRVMKMRPSPEANWLFSMVRTQDEVLAALEQIERGQSLLVA